MRILTYSAIMLLTTAILTFAQGVGQPPAKESVDTVLRGWEKAMTDLQSFACVVHRKTLDKALGSRDEHKGYAMFMKAAPKETGSRARLELTKVSNPKIFEKYICTGTFLYEYAPVNQTIRIHDMPQTKQAGMAQESFLSFLFGMGAEQAKQRYDLTVVYPTDGRPDPNYHYLQIAPKMTQDKSDFVFAQLCLYRANNLPARITYVQPNKNEIEWNFTDVQVNVQIPLKYFEPESIPNWRTERLQPKAAPAVAPAVAPTGRPTGK